MSDNSWRDNLEKVVEQNLNELIRETREYDYAIKREKDRSKAQIWVALALINHKINQLDISDKNNKYTKKIPKEELKDILETLEKL